MNVTIDAQRPVSGPGSTETTTTTYKPSAHAQGTTTVSRSGYTLDIADKVMDNEAYGGHGMTAEDIMQQAANSNAQSKKDFMIVMSSCVSGEDLQKMQEEGFQPGSTDVETYVTIVDRIKVTLAQAGVEVAGYNDELDVATIEQITGSRVDANALVNQLTDALCKSDIPVTADNVAELVSAVMEASGIGELSEDAVKYLVVNGKSPTIENIYKAQYSSAETIRQSQGYYSDGAGNGARYYAKKAEDINWDNLEQKIDAVVGQAGLDTDADTKAQAVENAKWLVSNGIELNAKNLTLVTDLRNLSLPMEQGDIADMCVTAMENGKAPAQADMTGEQSIAQQAHEIMEQTANISDEAVHETVEAGKEINIKNLSEAQRQIDEQAVSNAGVKNTDAEKASADNKSVEMAEAEPGADTVDETALKEVQARRQLEEIRLMMTEEANRHLLRAGILVDTTELSQLVEALKAAENNIRSILFQGEDAAQNEQRALIYEETISRTKELAGMPAAVLGKLLSKIPQSTLLHIHEAGKELENQLNGQNGNQNAGSGQNQNRQDRASAAYETLMTEPRKDLGDKISKAFRNIDEILTDLGLETSESNRRAVRILGYNRMDISEENINAVKSADSQVTGVISRMTPAATLQMIREQKNPLEMTMEELEDYLDNRDLDPAADAEKYSKFLQRLDRSNAISQEEREAYIGIYRMFRQIEKSDGAVIGSLVATGAQVNFKNMLSAVRTAADKNMDVRVDDGFGGLEDLITKGKAIDTQIQAGYQNRSGSESRQQAEQEKYYARLSGEINDELAQNTDFGKVNTADITGETTIEQFAENVKAAHVSEDSEARAREKAEDLKDFQSDMHKVEQIDEQIIDALVNYGQVINVDNIQAASMLIFDRGSVFGKVIRQNDKDAGNADETDSQDGGLPESDGADGDVLKQADTFIENLTDAGQAKVSYQEIISEANKAVEHMIYENASSHIDVKAAKALYKGLALAGNLAKEENYEIPMDIDGEITSVNLKIYHNASKTGKVAVTFDTEKFGKVAAGFDVRKNEFPAWLCMRTGRERQIWSSLSRQLQESLAGQATSRSASALCRQRRLT